MGRRDLAPRQRVGVMGVAKPNEQELRQRESDRRELVKLRADVVSLRDDLSAAKLAAKIAEERCHEMPFLRGELTRLKTAAADRQEQHQHELDAAFRDIAELEERLLRANERARVALAQAVELQREVGRLGRENRRLARVVSQVSALVGEPRAEQEAA